jgi:hypothetical protein
MMAASSSQENCHSRITFLAFLAGAIAASAIAYAATVEHVLQSLRAFILNPAVEGLSAVIVLPVLGGLLDGLFDLTGLLTRCGRHILVVSFSVVRSAPQGAAAGVVGLVVVLWCWCRRIWRTDPAAHGVSAREFARLKVQCARVTAERDELRLRAAQCEHQLELSESRCAALSAENAELRASGPSAHALPEQHWNTLINIVCHPRTEKGIRWVFHSDHAKNERERRVLDEIVKRFCELTSYLKSA